VLQNKVICCINKSYVGLDYQYFDIGAMWTVQFTVCVAKVKI